MRLLAALLAWPLVAGCASDDPTPAPTPRGPGSADGLTAGTPGPGADPADEPSAVTDPPPAPKVKRALLARDVRGFLDRWAKRERTFVAEHTKAFTKALEQLRWFKKLSTRAYEAREQSAIFNDGERLLPAAEQLLARLDALEAHGVDPKPYDRERLRQLVGDVADRRAAYEAAIAGVSDPREAALWKVVDKARTMVALDGPALEALLAPTGLSDDDAPLVARIEERVEATLSAKGALNTALREADLALLGAYFRYVYDMRYARRAHPFLADANDGAGVERTADALFSAFEETDFGKLDDALAALEPRLPDYRKLMEGLAFYRTLAAEVEQPQLPKAAERLRKGSKGETVTMLQRRLFQEGYFEGEADGKYGDQLAEAVRWYQETHQMKETGEMDAGTLRSMNRTYAERAEDIALGLMRHRESELHQGTWRFGEHPVQARINIPEFVARFYKDGEVARRHRVVVGNNAIEVDEQTGKRGHFNRTRMFSEEMRTIVLNPTWKVPRRIKETELDRELLEQPDYYEKHNYQVRILDDGTEEVVQMPGPNNALGLVKFLFPNRFSIYMHDTPRKSLFNREIRAFSHGCMRTEDPLDLARWILVEVEGMTNDRFDAILRSREEYGIALKNKIPITIDYNTVGVHETGKIMFFIDIYKFDRDYRDGKTPYAGADRGELEQVVMSP